MLYLYNYVANMFRREEGQGMAEYGLILALVAVVVIVALTALGGSISAKFDEVVAGLGGSVTP